MVSMLIVSFALLAAGQQPGAANDAGKTSLPAVAAAAGRAEYLALRAQDGGHGRRTLEARPLVRAERAQGRGPDRVSSGHPARFAA